MVRLRGWACLLWSRSLLGCCDSAGTAAGFSCDLVAAGIASGRGAVIVWCRRLILSACAARRPHLLQALWLRMLGGCLSLCRCCCFGCCPDRLGRNSRGNGRRLGAFALRRVLWALLVCLYGLRGCCGFWGLLCASAGTAAAAVVLVCGSISAGSAGGTGSGLPCVVVAVLISSRFASAGAVWRSGCGWYHVPPVPLPCLVRRSGWLSARVGWCRRSWCGCP